MNGHPIARVMDEWWRDNAGQHDSPGWQSYCKDLAGLFSTKFDELTSAHLNTDDDGVRRFGMSKAGGCTRAAALKLLGREMTPFTGSTLSTFHIGHLLECMAVATLKQVGLVIPSTQHTVRLDPFMQSASDGVIENSDGLRCGPLPAPCILSVKSAGYKKSGKQNGRWVRQGFPSLPFDGIKVANASAWAQAQAEMAGSGIRNTLVVVVAKDIVQAMKDDPYLMGEPGEGNGSMTFYAELVAYDPEFAEEQYEIWGRQWENAQSGQAGLPMYFRGATTSYVRLPQMADTASGWGGPNRAATGTFNPCFGCEASAACKTELASEYRR